MTNIKDIIADDDYAIYGHSMGSLLAYELYYKIIEQKLRKPKHIFFSGYKVPSIARKEEKICTLPDCDVSILNGKQDDIKLQEILGWRDHVCNGFRVYNFEGNHFFINNNTEDIITLINAMLDS